MKYLTVEAAMLMTGWSRKTVYNMASLHGWRRTKTRPARYHIDDIADTLDRKNRKSGNDVRESVY